MIETCQKSTGTGTYTLYIMSQTVYTIISSIYKYHNNYVVFIDTSFQCIRYLSVILCIGLRRHLNIRPSNGASRVKIQTYTNEYHLY